MKRWLVGLLALVLCGGLLLGCDSGSSGGGGDKAKVEKKEGGADGMKLTAEGKKFEPPIKPEALPEGAWYCDMGTVHYARSEKGDETCPVCKMKLKEKATAGK